MKKVKLILLVAGLVAVFAPSLLHGATLLSNNPLFTDYLLTSLSTLNNILSSSTFKYLAMSFALIGFVIAIASYMVSGSINGLVTSFFGIILVWFLGVVIRIPVNVKYYTEEYAIVDQKLQAYSSSYRQATDPRIPILGYIGVATGSIFAELLSSAVDTFMSTYSGVTFRTFPYDIANVLKQVGDQPGMQSLIDNVDKYITQCIGYALQKLGTQYGGNIKLMKEILSSSDGYITSVDGKRIPYGMIRQVADNYRIHLRDSITITCGEFYRDSIFGTARQIVESEMGIRLSNTQYPSNQPQTYENVASNRMLASLGDKFNLGRFYSSAGDILSNIKQAKANLLLHKVFMKRQEDLADSTTIVKEGTSKWFSKLAENISEVLVKWASWIAEIFMDKALPFLSAVAVSILALLYPLVVLFAFLPRGYTLLFHWSRAFVWIYTWIPTYIFVKQIKNALSVSKVLAGILSAQFPDLLNSRLINSFLVDSDVISIVTVAVCLGVMAITYSLIASGSIAGFGQGIAQTAGIVALSGSYVTRVLAESGGKLAGAIFGGIAGAGASAGAGGGGAGGGGAVVSGGSGGMASGVAGEVVGTSTSGIGKSLGPGGNGIGSGGGAIVGSAKPSVDLPSGSSGGSTEAGSSGDSTGGISVGGDSGSSGNVVGTTSDASTGVPADVSTGSSGSSSGGSQVSSGNLESSAKKFMSIFNENMKIDPGVLYLFPGAMRPPHPEAPHGDKQDQ